MRVQHSYRSRMVTVLYSAAVAVDTGKGFETGGGYRRKGEVKIPGKLYRAMEEDEILEIIAAILRVL